MTDPIDPSKFRNLLIPLASEGTGPIRIDQFP